ncbi:MAG: exodeoxyribonuclease VII small subunit [Nakamurella sp.]
MSPAKKAPATTTDPTSEEPDAPLSYEQARDELAQVVGTLESGGLDLEESLTLWERGEQLARRCEALLDGAQARVRAVLDRVEDEELDELEE